MTEWKEKVLPLIIILIICLILFFVLGLLLKSSRAEDGLANLERKRTALTFQSKNDFWNPKIIQFLSIVQGWTISQTRGIVDSDFEKTSKVGGFSRDLTGDGKKEWVYQETTLGASGYTTIYKVYQRKGLGLKLVWEAELSDDHTEFFESKIVVTEPVWDEGCHACVSKFNQKIFRWNGQSFVLTQDDIIDTLGPSLQRFTV